MVFVGLTHELFASHIRVGVMNRDAAAADHMSFCRLSCSFSISATSTSTHLSLSVLRSLSCQGVDAGFRL